MKLKITILLLGVAGFVISASAQENFVFLNYLGDTASFEMDEMAIENHFLGEQMAVKYTRVRLSYTYVSGGSGTHPVSETIVDKPTIYKSIKKLNSHYKKQFKKGEIDTSTAIRELGWYLDVGFAIYRQNTDDFEEALKSAKKPDQIALVFDRIVFE
ncbi:MAG TPA: hypothetical protein ENI20_05250 [Bacteroides sp.]|nr:hypothetical protein [Bacteroides sp.]